MQDRTTIYDMSGRLLRDTFPNGLEDPDAFLVFVLFHMYQIELTGAVLADRPTVIRINADTQRGCAAALASLWSDTDDERSDYAYWYHRWNSGWGSYGRAENLSNEEVSQLLYLMFELERHPFVTRFVPEDDDPTLPTTGN